MKTTVILLILTLGTALRPNTICAQDTEDIFNTTLEELFAQMDSQPNFDLTLRLTPSSSHKINEIKHHNHGDYSNGSIVSKRPKDTFVDEHFVNLRMFEPNSGIEIEISTNNSETIAIGPLITYYDFYKSLKDTLGKFDISVDVMKEPERLWHYSRNSRIQVDIRYDVQFNKMSMPYAPQKEIFQIKIDQNGAISLPAYYEVVTGRLNDVESDKIVTPIRTMSIKSAEKITVLDQKQFATNYEIEKKILNFYTKFITNGATNLNVKNFRVTVSPPKNDLDIVFIYKKHIVRCVYTGETIDKYFKRQKRDDVTLMSNMIRKRKKKLRIISNDPKQYCFKREYAENVRYKEKRIWIYYNRNKYIPLPGDIIKIN
ncbi:hypothetical protein [Formosa sp. PL04]|uniref:hypothetical protein n=1 Tax=Formosa sp. PL04 TaxID=3081755 RepID=UPI002980EC7F|nr:hypothetical protein [Formosa sp. PL04]MDW5288892.1 hypothetical protein [Formosa sp. PL04]